jgi:hypothetical protein
LKGTLLIILTLIFILVGCGQTENNITEGKLTKNELVEMVDSMISKTQNNPNLLLSSNPYDYINAHQDTYNSIISGGQETVTIFVDILENSTTFGLDKYIMAAACSQITGIGNNNTSENIKQWSTAQEWLKLYKDTI